ncbi:predicted protein, partial [Nematostella vectensis]
TFSFASPSYSVEEDTGYVTVNITKTGTSDIHLDVKLSTNNGTAFSPVDYTAMSDNSVTFLANEQSKLVNITINVDQTVENDEDFKALLSHTNADQVALGLLNTTTITIGNDDQAIFSFAAASYSVVEDTGYVTVTINKTGLTDVDLSVLLNTEDGTAVSPVDFTALVNGTVNFPANEPSLSVNISIIVDNKVENNETFKAVISSNNPSQVAIGLTSSTDLTIQNDDMVVGFLGCCGAYKENYCMVTTFAVLLAFIFVLEIAAGALAYAYKGKLEGYVRTGLKNGVDHYDKKEYKKAMDKVQGEGDSALLVFTCSGNNEIDFNFRLSSTPGTATVADYTLANDTSLTCAPGVTTTTFSVPTVQDVMAETTESFIVSISANAGEPFNFIDRVATVSIIDTVDKVNITISASTYATNEGAGPVTVVIEKTDNAEINISASVYTSNVPSLTPRIKRDTWSIPPSVNGTTTFNVELNVIQELAISDRFFVLLETDQAFVSVRGNKKLVVAVAKDKHGKDETLNCAVYSILKGGEKSSELKFQTQ